MYKAIAANKRNTVLVMAMFLLIIGAIGGVVGYFTESWEVAALTIGIAAVYALIQYFIAAKLAVMMTGGQKIERSDNPRLWDIVENLAISEGLPMPAVYVIHDPAPNAFATGRSPKHAVVGATTGLMDVMDDEELRAVMAHEMGHVKNYDIRVSMIVFGLVSLIGLLSWMVGRTLMSGGRDRDARVQLIMIVVGLAVMILAPVFAMIVQMAVSRQREYLADSSAAMMTRYPEGMIRALEKLKEFGRPMKTENPAMEAMFISNPLKKGFMNRLFSTHPPLEKRIERLTNAKGKF